ncbi:MAG: autotransporter outer membrane beta-barrel domain-containing protein, partial [Anaerolineae bacterium]|nr:autotransporter outer membrane beta-barrel domain-containing protein [Anaerolineae bacterium]
TSASGGAQAFVSGGHGVEFAGNTSSSLDPSAVVENVISTGGAGGIATNFASFPNAPALIYANGGSGLNIGRSPPFASLTIRGANSAYQGGDGGTAVSLGSTVQADAGHGISIQGKLGETSTELVIYDGRFYGGSGGIAEGISNLTVNGGSGLFAANCDISIHDGEFYGGLGGASNGVRFADAAAVKIVDSKFLIEDGSFGVDSKGLEILSTVGESIDGTVSNGQFGFVEIGGSGANGINITGGSFESFLFSGSATNTITLNGTTVLSDGIRQIGGIVTFTNWIDSIFKDTSLSSGVMVFENQNLHLYDGSIFRIENQGVMAKFNDGLTIKDGAILDIGLGGVEASNLLAETGSHLLTEYADGGSNTFIFGTIAGNDLAFETNLTWTIYGMTTNTRFADKVLLATATNNVNHDLKFTDFDIVGNPEWLKGITNVVEEGSGSITNIYAYYGQRVLMDVLVPEKGSEYFKVTEELDRLLPLASPQRQSLDDRLGRVSEEEGKKIMEEGYTRTPEVANALISMQSIFADQIKNRTRAYLRLKNWGSSAMTPAGVSGPEYWYDDSIQWLNDHLPRWDISEAARSLDERLPKVKPQGDATMEGKHEIDVSSRLDSKYKTFTKEAGRKIPKLSRDKIEVPRTYQVWGRGYGSYLDQKNTEGHEGYRAQIGGVVVGVDKRFSNLLAGVGGGYAFTSVSGNSKNEAAVHTGHGVAYLAANGEHVYFDANVNYAFHTVDTEGDAVLGYSGKYDADTA